MYSVLQILATLQEGESVTFSRDTAWLHGDIAGITMRVRKRNPPRCLCFNECRCLISQKDFSFSQLMAERAEVCDVLALHLQDQLATIRDMASGV